VSAEAFPSMLSSQRLLLPGQMLQQLRCQALAPSSREAEPAQVVEQRSLMRLIAPNHLQSILFPDSHVSSPNSANRPVLPAGVSKILKHPIPASETIRCGIQKTCDRIDRTSNTPQFAGRWVSVGHSLCPLQVAGSGRSFFDNLRGLHQCPSSMILQVEIPPHQKP
jgi:hypothetical protein